MKNEKINEVVAKGKDFYNKGNELMDKVKVLKNPLYKKIVWGVLCLVCLLAIGRIFGCGGDPSGDLGEDHVVDVCKKYITQRRGEDSLKKFEVVGVQVNGNRAILKADVDIHDPGSIAPVRDAFDAVGTAVFYLEEREDDVYVVDFSLE